MENIGLYYVNGCEMQDHFSAGLEIITAVFWNVRPFLTISRYRSTTVVVTFQGRFKTEDEDTAVIRNVGNYVITVKLKSRQTLLFIF
jgi:hypothetical protein